MHPGQSSGLCQVRYLRTDGRQGVTGAGREGVQAALTDRPLETAWRGQKGQVAERKGGAEAGFKGREGCAGRFVGCRDWPRGRGLTQEGGGHVWGRCEAPEDMGGTRPGARTRLPRDRRQEGRQLWGDDRHHLGDSQRDMTVSSAHTRTPGRRLYWVTGFSEHRPGKPGGQGPTGEARWPCAGHWGTEAGARPSGTKATGCCPSEESRAVV